MRLGAVIVMLHVVPTPSSCKRDMLHDQHDKVQAGLSIHSQPALGFGLCRSL